MSTAIDKVSDEAFFSSATAVVHQIEDATPALRTFGNRGPALVFIHGFPTHGYTWRKLLPELSKHFVCYVIDLPGMGASDWTDNTDFSFTRQTHRLSVLLNERLGLANYDVIAHDTGATLARMLALANPGRVGRLIAFNTEIPHHRPPWVEFYQRLAALPGANSAFRAVLRSKWLQRSGAGFGQLYTDKALLNDPVYVGPYLEPVLASARRMDGFLSYLTGIEWDVIDRFEHTHKQIRADTLFLWGANDKTFPMVEAQSMLTQFAQPAQLIPLDASLLPHEECHLDALDHIRRFLQRG